MSSYPPAPPPYSGPPAPSGKQKLRGRIPLRLAAIFGVIGLGLVIGGIIALINSPLAKIGDFERVRIGSEQTVRFDRTGGYTGYFETPTGSDGRANVRLAIVDSSGAEVPVKLYGRDGSSTSSLKYNDIDGYNGEALFTFSIPESGQYRVATESSDAPSGSRMAFGESIANGLVLGVVLIVPGALLLIAAIILLIVGLVRRSGHKRELRQYGGGYGQPGHPPAYGPPQ
ncbi:hypothetical protein [Jatrophihabitans fulvus]